MNLTPAQVNITLNTKLRCYRLTQPIVPNTLVPPDYLRVRLQASEQRLFALNAREPSIFAQNLRCLEKLSPKEIARDLHIAPLRHRLGEHSIIRCRIHREGLPSRMDAERSALDIRCDALMQTLNNPHSHEFIEELLTLSALVRGLSNIPFRSGGIRLAGDRAGWFWEFPDHKGIGKCLEELHKVLFLRSLGNALIEATVAYGILNWLHPFTDGNGRTSRMLFNAVLRRGGFSTCQYIPIKEINYLAYGGHEVRLRYTVATGDWTELLEYFVNMATLYEVLLHRKGSR